MGIVYIFGPIRIIVVSLDSLSFTLVLKYECSTLAFLLFSISSGLVGESY